MHASRADLSQAFCTYCGYPPMGRWRSRAHRVCLRCARGVVLRSAPGFQPRFDEPFVIVDDHLRLQAISHHAETVLRVEAAAAMDAPLDRFLHSANGDQNHSRLGKLITRVIGGATLASTVELRTVGDPRIGFDVRIAACGPPPAALLLLTSVAGPNGAGGGQG